MSEFVTVEVHTEFAKRIEEENTRQNHQNPCHANGSDGDGTEKARRSFGRDRKKAREALGCRHHRGIVCYRGCSYGGDDVGADPIMSENDIINADFGTFCIEMVV